MNGRYFLRKRSAWVQYSVIFFFILMAAMSHELKAQADSVVYYSNMQASLKKYRVYKYTYNANQQLTLLEVYRINIGGATALRDYLGFTRFRYRVSDGKLSHSWQKNWDSNLGIYGNSKATIYTYNGTGELAKTVEGDSVNGVFLGRYKTVYDNYTTSVGSYPISKRDYEWFGNWTLMMSEAYSYNSNNQLIQKMWESHYGASSGNNSRTDFLYDAMGRLSYTDFYWNGLGYYGGDFYEYYGQSDSLKLSYYRYFFNSSLIYPNLIQEYKRSAGMYLDTIVYKTASPVDSSISITGMDVFYSQFNGVDSKEWSSSAADYAWIPGRQSLILYNPKQEKGQMVLFDGKGQAHTFTIDGREQQEIFIGFLRSGLYLIQGKTENQWWRGKIIRGT